MPVNVSAVVSVILGMLPGVAAVGVAVLGVRSAIEAFKYIREAMGYGPVDPNDPNDPRNYEEQGEQYGGGVAAVAEEDPYNNARVRAIHEENGWDPEWDEK